MQRLKYILVIILGLLSISFVYGQQSSDMEEIPRIPWDAYTILNIRDFGIAPVKKEVPFHSQGQCGIEDQTHFLYFLFKRNLNKQVVAYFDPNHSWIKRDGKTIPMSLQYEQTIFDMYEVAARRLRKKYREHNRWKLVFGAAREIQKEVYNDLNRRIYSYRITSNYGTGEFQQMKWRYEVKRDVSSLEIFAYDAKIEKEVDREKRKELRRHKKILAKEKRDAKRLQKEQEKAMMRAEKEQQEMDE
ncbi:hypothetical protein K5X82_18780 [Halosquirtibacter xylanolyticus]|uniref:hypothetical protein n=1 Tax=Halosquirtibacter xylanolyticus TaxID=3374599 RepID=UPI00374964AD|nr:hypothetical protein K5X82_18780 [Prolixibacteraceae bacterium]